jgi:hypothetical protein
MQQRQLLTRMLLERTLERGKMEQGPFHWYMLGIISSDRCGSSSEIFC